MSTPAPYTQSLLLHAYQATARRLVAALHGAGHDRIRPKHGAVFANIDREGTRATELAARAGMGKPAMGELIAELERLGYVERRPDPSDQRAKLVVPTRRAIDLIAVVHEVNARIERDLGRRLGAQGRAELRRALEAVAPGAQAQPRIR
jgi:DNA-binding MarR family transcriptional regulator